MAGNVGVASNQVITELFQSIETAWNATDFTQDETIQKLSWMKTGKGKQDVLAFSNMSSLPVTLTLGADRQFGDPEVFKVVVDHDIIVPQQSLEIYQPQIAWDKYDILQLQGDATQVISGARNIWILRLAGVINANPVGWDGVSHFNTLHPVNPVRPLLGFYSNDLAATDLDEAGLASALDSLMTAPWMDGNIDPTRARKICIVVPTMALFNKAVRLVGIPLALVPSIGTSAGTSVAATTPYSYGGSEFQFEVVYCPFLVQAGVAATMKRWYLMNMTHPTKRGFVTSVVQYPQLAIEGSSPNDHIRVTKLAMRATWDANGGVAPGLPREVVRATTP